MQIQLTINVGNKFHTKIESRLVVPDDISKKALMKEIAERRKEMSRKKKSILSKRARIVIDSARPSTQIFKRMLVYKNEG